MNDEQDSGPKPQVPGSKSADGRSDATPPPNPDPSGLESRSSASEIAGETVDVVGEATGAFPRAEAVEREERESTAKSAFMVGAGILLSRIIGVVRQRVFAHYLGTSDAMGAFSAAFRLPNFLQSVFGEGAFAKDVLQKVRDSERRAEGAHRVRSAEVVSKHPLPDDANNPAQEDSGADHER